MKKLVITLRVLFALLALCTVIFIGVKLQSKARLNYPDIKLISSAVGLILLWPTYLLIDRIGRKPASKKS
jgi:uncharacterized membrane protein YjjP (DUF1212 family)